MAVFQTGDGRSWVHCPAAATVTELEVTSLNLAARLASVTDAAAAAHGSSLTRMFTSHGVNSVQLIPGPGVHPAQ